MKVRRAQLYVPGNNEHMISKAAGLTLDSLIIDLEDAVPLSQKDNAREIVRKSLDQLEFKAGEICLRINPLNSRDSLKDLLSLSTHEKIDTLVIPKAETGLRNVHAISGKGILALVETPRGLINVETIATTEGVECISWASGDLAACVGGDPEEFSRNDYVRTRVVMSARAHGIDPIDRVFFNIKDLEGLRLEAANSKKIGFSGKQVIHPSHVEPVVKVFTPSEKEVEWARKVLEALNGTENTQVGAVRMDDALIDMVHVRMARNILNIKDS